MTEEGEVLAVEGETSRLVRHRLEEIRGQPPKLGSMDAAFRAVWPEAAAKFVSGLHMREVI